MNTYLIRKVLKNLDSLFKAAYLPYRLAGLSSVQNSCNEVCCLTPAKFSTPQFNGSIYLFLILFGNHAYDEELLRRCNLPRYLSPVHSRKTRKPTIYRIAAGLFSVSCIVNSTDPSQLYVLYNTYQRLCEALYRSLGVQPYGSGRESHILRIPTFIHVSLPVLPLFGVQRT